MASVIRGKEIKSADRVLQIFEMFAEGRQSVSVMDVARALGVPQSSTSELLGSLVRRGYLYRDRLTRAFRPTARVALLGAWVQPHLFRQGHLLRMMDSLGETTGRSVVLASMIGLGIKHVHVAGLALPRELASGTEHHALHSPFGIALMSLMYRDNVRKIVHRLNAESPPSHHMRYQDVEERLNRASRQGYFAGDLGEGIGAVAVLLPERLGEEQLVVGIAGPRDSIAFQCDQLVQELRGTIAHFLSGRSNHDARQTEWPVVAAAN